MSSIFSWACWLFVCLFYFYFLRNGSSSVGPFCNRTIWFLKIVLLLTCGSFWLFWKVTLYQLMVCKYVLPFQGLAFHCGCFHLLCRSSLVWCSPSCLVLLLSPVLGACSRPQGWGDERFSLPQMVLGKLDRMNCTPTLHHTHKIGQRLEDYMD